MLTRHRIRRPFELAASVVMSIAMATPTGAEPGDVSLLNWIFDGAVQTAVRLGDVLYVGGTFTALAPSANALPPVYALSETTGAVVGPTFPAMDGDVQVVEPDGTGGYFVAGTFTTVGGVTQPTLAHVLADGSVDIAFRPVVTGSIIAMGRLGPTLYLAGSSLTIGGAFSHSLGAVAVSDGARVAWQPSPVGGIGPTSLVVADDRVVVSGTESVPMVQSGVAGAFDAATGATLWYTYVAPGGVRLPRGAGTMVRAGAHVIVAHTLLPSGRGLSKLSLTTGVVDETWNPQVSPSTLALAGATLYLGGSFTTVAGQPRASLAAIDVTTAALLPWNPSSLTPIQRMAAAGGGGVYVSGLFDSLAGQPRHRIARIDAAGAIDSWVADARPDSVYTLTPGAAGTVVVSSSLTASGNIARRRLAAFDLTTGNLLSWAPVADRPVSLLAAAAGRVTLTGALTAIDGEAAPGAAALDPTTGARLQWSPNGPGVGAFVDDTWLYWAAGTAPSGPYTLERYALATGARDASWRAALPGSPPTAGVADGDTLFVAASTGLYAIDRRTARLRWANPTANVRYLAVSGDTLFTDAGLTALTAVDARTGQAIASSPAPTGFSAMTVADGRVIVNGSEEPSLGFNRRPIARRFDGTTAPWNPRLRPTLVGGPAETLVVAGDRLVAGGIFGRRPAPALQGLAVFPLSGAVAPAGLRARPRGPATEFTWDAPASPPAAGYVLEASVVPGQPIFALPLGGVTSYSGVVPPGLFYVRVRAAGAASGRDELSNEIAVRGGCAAAPAPPTGLVAGLAGSLVTLSWTASDALVDRYLLDVGTASGQANLLTATVAGGQTSFAAAAPPATYFVRARAVNACGTSAPSGEVSVTVGAIDPLPAAPTGLTAAVSGSSVHFTWSAPAGPVTGYVLEAGPELGVATIGSFALGPTPVFAVAGVPPGVYAVRVRAINGAGSSPPSSDVVVRVP